MATTETEAPTASAGWLRRAWQAWLQVGGVLAVITLVDLTGQLIKWAAVIHWIAAQYAVVRAWLFGWLPFHILPALHDPIVLLLILFGVANVGVYRRTGRNFVSLAISEFGGGFVATIAGAGVALLLTLIISNQYFTPLNIILSIGLAILSLMIGFVAAIIAWRWLLITAAIFGALILVNQVYVLWLEPLAEHY
jgi:hypothetical protein